LDRDNKTKFIFVSGGVVSSLGKGLAAARCWKGEDCA
jgi:hypothetical protein